MKRLHLVRERHICEKCGMLILSGDSTPVEEKWLASEVNCSKVQPQYKSFPPLTSHHH